MLCCNPFIEMYLHMLIASLQFVTLVKARVLRAVHSHVCRESRAAGGTWLSTYTATSDRGTRQLTVNPLYSI
jgi:hypothetical protein